MTNDDDDDVPVYHVSEEDAKYFEEEEHRVNALLIQKKTKRVNSIPPLCAWTHISYLYGSGIRCMQ